MKKSKIDRLRKELKQLNKPKIIKEKKVIEKIELPNLKHEKKIIEDKFFNLDHYYDF
jgi:hypothetical protein